MYDRIATRHLFAVSFLVLCVYGSVSAQWAKTTSPTTTYIRALLVKDSFLFAGTSGASVLRSTDDGFTWNPANAGLGPYSIFDFGKEGENLFVSSTGGVFRSTDNGAHWAYAQQGIIEGYYILSFATRDSTLFAVSFGKGAYRTRDHGATWTSINNGLTSVWLTFALATDEGVFIGSSDNGVFRTTDDGDTWVPVSNGLPWAHYDASKHNTVTSLCYSASWLYAGFEYAGVYRSSDGGASWQVANNGFLDVFMGSIQSLCVAGQAILASTLNYGIYSSTNGGDSWIQINEGFDNNSRSMDVMVVKGSKIFAVPYYGSDLWWRPLSEITSVNELSSGLPPQFRLEQNFPNPFNPTTNIEYQLPEPSYVTLKVYDVLGQEVATVVRGEEPAGRRSLVFDASSLPSGVYVYRLTAGARVLAKKFIMVR
jgi:photosystem II stability/assembly factor-like uncharacterized protein